MKRLVVIVFAVCSVSHCFAYYGDYSSSPSFELPGWVTFMGILMIAWGILEIILFFKIWGMTNDIRALKNDHFNQTTNEIPTSQLVNDIRKNLLLGDIDKVKKALLMKFTDDISILIGNFQFRATKRTRMAKTIWFHIRKGI